MILAIDPGTTESQYVIWDGTRVLDAGLIANAALLSWLSNPVYKYPGLTACIEMVASFGMPVGREVFETVYWIGRFDQRLRDLNTEPVRVARQAVKLHLCHSARAKDANIRQALLDRFGGKEAAIGRKATPGPLYGVKSHAWAALALAVTFAETHASNSAAIRSCPDASELVRTA
jgi:hypothetical protein